jgi:hypothetical protein
MSAKKHDSMTREQLLAMRDIKAAAAVDPAAEARRHEASFLGNMKQAKADFDWIVAHEAWTQLGHATFADWWDVRVMPVAAGLGMRPTREIARTVIEKVVEDQRDLPKAQQRTQREIAAMVGVDRSTVARSTPGANARGSDLEATPVDAVDAMHAALEDIDAHLAGQRTEDTDEDGDRPNPDPSPALPETQGVAPGSAPAEQEEPRDGSPPADERPQDESGVSSPAAAPQLVETPIGPMTRKFAEQLDRLVPDPNPHREWQTRFLDSVFAAAKAMRGYTGAEIAAKADDQLRAEFADFVGEMDALLHETSKAQLARADNVRPLRRVK